MLARSEYSLLEPYTKLHGPDSWKKYLVKHERCGEQFMDDLGIVPRCPKCFPLRGIYRSRMEEHYSSLIMGMGFKVEVSYRDAIKLGGRPAELDIYLPDLKIAFEVNGLYWHSVNDRSNKTKDYHSRKSDAAIAVGIKLYHIWEHFDPSIVESK